MNTPYLYNTYLKFILVIARNRLKYVGESSIRVRVVRLSYMSGTLDYTINTNIKG